MCAQPNMKLLRFYWDQLREQQTFTPRDSERGGGSRNNNRIIWRIFPDQSRIRLLRSQGTKPANNTQERGGCG